MLYFKYTIKVMATSSNQSRGILMNTGLKKIKKARLAQKVSKILTVSNI